MFGLQESLLLFVFAAFSLNYSAESEYTMWSTSWTAYNTNEMFGTALGGCTEDTKYDICHIS